MNQTTGQKAERKEATHAAPVASVTFAGAEPPAPPQATPDDGPSAAHAVRLVATPVVLVAAGAAVVAWGHPAIGGVLVALGILVAAAQAAIGAFVVKVTLREHANMFKTLAPLMGPVSPRRASAGAGREGDAADEDRERAIDAAVGFGLTRAAACGGFAAGSMSEEGRSRLSAHVLAERARTYAWLQGAPAWREVRIEAEDGARLVAESLVADAASDRWVLLCHGYAGTWDSMLQYARPFAEAGYNLLVPHMRAHGESGGRFIGMGWLDRRDVVSWSRWLVAEGASSLGSAVPRAVVLLGHSMGASSVCMAAGEPDVPAEVRALVADCGFDTSWHALSSSAQAAGLPVHPTIDLARMSLALRPGGYDLAKGDVAGALGRTRVPVLIVHGTADTMVPPYMAGVLARSCACGARVLMVPDAGHCQSSLLDPELYWGEVLAFCDACCAEAPTCAET